VCTDDVVVVFDVVVEDALSERKSCAAAADEPAARPLK
jgi:hypothetical protein